MQLVSGSERMRRDNSSNGVYERVKARVIAHEFPSGKRIQPEPIAEQLFVSYTPVREALARLAAERLVNEVPKAGFFAKELSESETRGLYALQHLLLDWSLTAIEDIAGVPRLLKPPELLREVDDATQIPPSTAVRMMETLYEHIAIQSGNDDVTHIVRNINDRTYFVRMKYLELFDDVEGALKQLCQVYGQKEFGALRECLRVFFHNKMRRLPSFLKALR